MSGRRKERQICPNSTYSDTGANAASGESYGKDYFGERFAGRFSQYWWARRFYASLVARYRTSGRVLEIGCGLGHVLKRLDDRFETYGIDISPYAIEEARGITPASVLRVGPAEDVTKLPGPFDAIAAFHVFEHLSDPGSVLRDCARMTKAGGMLFYATPNTDAPFAKRKGARWYANTDPTHISMKPPREWIAMTERAGYRVRKAFGDGLWDVPYLPLIPAKVQILIFGLPAAVQTLTTVPFIPVRFGEALIVVAERE